MESGTKLGDSKMGICPSSARARFCRESAPPSVRDGIVDVASHLVCDGDVRRSRIAIDVGDSDVGAKLTTLQRRVASSRVPWLLLAVLASFA
jgi:hypothetical protein